jgi:hypothetical protein
MGMNRNTNRDWDTDRYITGMGMSMDVSMGIKTGMNMGVRTRMRMAKEKLFDGENQS